MLSLNSSCKLPIQRGDGGGRGGDSAVAGAGPLLPSMSPELCVCLLSVRVFVCVCLFLFNIFNVAPASAAH